MTRDTPFGSLVRHRRVELGISQAGLADLVGRSASAIRSWERGSSTPTDDAVVRSLAAVLGLDEGELLTIAGMPADRDEGAEVVGDQGLVFFSEKPDGDGPAAESEAGEISWDDVAESVVGGAEPRPPAEPSEAETDAAGVDEPSEDDPVEEAEAAEPDYSPPGDEGEPADDQPAVPEEEPDQAASEPDLIPVSTTSRARPELTGAELPTAPAAASRTTVMPVSEPVAPPAANSYLDDPDQMMTYWIRAALTVALTMFLVIVLFWALGNLGDSIGEVWDLFRAAS